MALQNPRFFLQALKTLCKLVDEAKKNLKGHALKIKMHKIITELIEDITL